MCVVGAAQAADPAASGACAGEHGALVFGQTGMKIASEAGTNLAGNLWPGFPSLPYKAGEREPRAIYKETAAGVA